MKNIDPILEEVHSVREKLAQEYQYDIHKIAQHFKEEELIKKVSGKVRRTKKRFVHA